VQDVINPRTPHCNIMILKCRDDHDDGLCDNYCYAKVLGIHHVNIICVGNIFESRRLDFLFVRWYETIQNHSWETCTLDRVHLMPLSDQNAFSFVDPAIVLRACHIIPAFSRGQQSPNECGLSPLAGDKNDWYEYYINMWVFLRVLFIFTDGTLL
jgi:hypothetical protein